MSIHKCMMNTKQRQNDDSLQYTHLIHIPPFTRRVSDYNALMTGSHTDSALRINASPEPSQCLAGTALWSLSPAWVCPWGLVSRVSPCPWRMWWRLLSLPASLRLKQAERTQRCMKNIASRPIAYEYKVDKMCPLPTKSKLQWHLEKIIWHWNWIYRQEWD